MRRPRCCSDDALAARQRAAGSGQGAARSAGASAAGSLNQSASRLILGKILVGGRSSSALILEVV